MKWCICFRRFARRRLCELKPLATENQRPKIRISCSLGSWERYSPSRDRLFVKHSGKMAPLRVISVKSPSWTAQNIYNFFLFSLFFVYNKPLLLMVVIFRSWSTLTLYAWQTQKQTGSCPSRSPSNQNASLQSKTCKESTEISSSSSTGTSRYQGKGKPSPFDSKKSTTFEYSPADDYSSMEEDSNCFDIGEEFSTLGIHDIVSFLRLANYKSRNLNMPADERKEINGSLLGSSGVCE